MLLAYLWRVLVLYQVVLQKWEHLRPLLPDFLPRVLHFEDGPGHPVHFQRPILVDQVLLQLLNVVEA